MSELIKSLIIFCISMTDIGSIPANGSSSNKNFGSMASARAISTRRLSPPDRLAPLFSSIFSICRVDISESSFDTLCQKIPCPGGDGICVFVKGSCLT